MSDGDRGGNGLSRSAAGKRNPWLIASIVSIATFMLVLDTSIANVALRHIAGSLAAGVPAYGWGLARGCRIGWKGSSAG